MLAGGYSYVITRDYGFAPNPFGAYCTLATCKPRIRKMAGIGSWIVGCSSRSNGGQSRMVVYAMQVAEAMAFQEYWNDSRFEYKKPRFNGSLAQAYGDNIYHKTPNGVWLQENSHHSLDDGSTNILNLNRDTSVDRVLVATLFYYFGGQAISLPRALDELVIYASRGEKKFCRTTAQNLGNYLSEHYCPGITGWPVLFNGGFSRYNGK